MSGQANLMRFNDRFTVISSNTQLRPYWTYHCTGANTHTLPDTSTLAVGDWVKLTKKIGVDVNVQRFGATVLIRVFNNRLQVPQTDSSIIFDIEAEIIFVWNGTEWEV